MTDSRYDVIVADPPWSYRNWSDAKSGAASAAMTVQPEANIAQIPVAQWAARDCVLLCWGTWPKLPEALRVIEAWGFEWVTACPWVKTTPPSADISTGIGFWFQSTSEVLIVAKRGDPRTKRYPILGLMSGDERQFYYPVSRKHSRKPEDIYDWIEVRCGSPESTRYLELFATRQRPGWTCWGSELGHWLNEDGVSALPPPPPPAPPPPPEVD